MGYHWLLGGTPILFFFIYTEICCRRFVFLIHSDWIPIKIIAPWCRGLRTLQVFYRFFIELIAYRFDAYRTSEAGNGETDPSTLSSLVGNFPCMPLSPAFTHSSLEGLGPSFHTTWTPIDVYGEVKDSLLLNANTISPNIAVNSITGGAEYTTRGHYTHVKYFVRIVEPWILMSRTCNLWNPMSATKSHGKEVSASVV